MRLIDADVLKDSFKDKEGNEFTAFHFYEAIEKAPTLPNPCGKPCAFERPHGEWIPCSERLPNPEDTVLFCNQYGEVCIGCKFRTGGIAFIDYLTSNLTYATAWMPLPEPYEKGETNG